MKPEERATTLKFYDILQEKVKTYVEGSPEDLFYYQDKNTEPWDGLICGFGVLLRKGYTTSQMLKEPVPLCNYSNIKHPEGTPFIYLPFEAITFMHCYVIKDQSQMHVYVRISKADEMEYNASRYTNQTEFDRIIYMRDGYGDIFDFRMDGKELVDCYEQKALEIAEIFRKRLASAVILYQELKRYAKIQQRLLERKKEIEDKYKTEMIDLNHTYGVYIDKMRRLVETQNAGMDFTTEAEDGTVSD